MSVKLLRPEAVAVFDAYGFGSDPTPVSSRLNASFEPVLCIQLPADLLDINIPSFEKNEDVRAGTLKLLRPLKALIMASDIPSDGHSSSF